jgi:hypothetical protein
MRRLNSGFFLTVVFTALCGPTAEAEMTRSRYYQIVREAAEKNDMAHCEQIDDELGKDSFAKDASESRYFCKADYALLVGDIELCQTFDDRTVVPGTASQRATCLYDLAVKLNQPERCGDASLVDMCKRRIEDVGKCLIQPEGLSPEQTADRQVGCLAVENYTSGKPVICDVIDLPNDAAATEKARAYCWSKVESGNWEPYLAQVIDLPYGGAQ